MLKMKPWTLGLCGLGLVSLAGLASAEEKPNAVQALTATSISGYVDTSAIWLFGTGNTLYGRSYDGSSKQDGFNLDVVKLQIDGPPLQDGQWSASYAVGLLFGPDANALASTSSGILDSTSDFAIKNAYVSLRAPVGNGLDFKIGVWDTLIGYEVFEAGNNPNFSRSYGFYLEPVIHTGLLASYKFNDVLSIAGGVADSGNVNTINARSSVESLKTYLGSFTVTAPESAGFLKGAALVGGVVDSGISSGEDIVNYYIGGTLPLPITGLSLGAAYDYRANGLFSGSYENAIAGYVLWQATEKLKVNTRLDYGTGSNGAYGVTTTPDADNVKLLSTVLTLDYSLWANVISRAEFRWDHSASGQPLFLDGSEKDAFSLALNVIYKF